MGAAWPSAAQDMPRIQVFGGYSYTRYDTPSFGFSDTTGLQRIHFLARLQLDQGIRGGGGTERTIQDRRKPARCRGRAAVSLRERKHVVVSDASSSARPARWYRSGGPQEDTSRVIIGGGGLDYNISSRFAVRAFQVDYVHTNLFTTTQNNLRFSTGLVYRWGTIKKTHRTLAPNP